MRILYIHGFGSQYDPEHEKIKQLETLGTVVGVNVDYTRGYMSVFNKITDAIHDSDVTIDLIVGTSMGGFMSAQIGAGTGIPFVAINPAIEPRVSLQNYVGTHEGFNGKEFTLTESVVVTYPSISQKGVGLVLLDRADEILSASNTDALLRECYNVVMYQGGCHRFAHMEDSLEAIKAHHETALATYGVTND